MISLFTICFFNQKLLFWHTSGESMFMKMTFKDVFCNRPVSIFIKVFVMSPRLSFLILFTSLSRTLSSHEVSFSFRLLFLIFSPELCFSTPFFKPPIVDGDIFNKSSTCLTVFSSSYNSHAFLSDAFSLYLSNFINKNTS